VCFRGTFLVAKEWNDRTGFKDQQRLVTDVAATLVALGKVEIADSIEVWKAVAIVMHAVDTIERNLCTRPVARILSHSFLTLQ
jgi:hypothetical protein